MKNYPAKSSKRKPQVETDRFDQSKLTASDLELLNDFEERRREFNRLIEESTILYHKKTCPGCGFPTIDENEFFSTCILCLWEGDVSEKNAFNQSAPNYTSVTEHRINISSFLRKFLETHEIEPSIDAIIKSVREFEAGEKSVDRGNFEANLVNILPTRTIKQ